MSAPEVRGLLKSLGALDALTGAFERAEIERGLLNCVSRAVVLSGGEISPTSQQNVTSSALAHSLKRSWSRGGILRKRVPHLDAV